MAKTTRFNIAIIFIIFIIGFSILILVNTFQTTSNSSGNLGGFAVHQHMVLATPIQIA